MKIVLMFLLVSAAQTVVVAQVDPHVINNDAYRELLKKERERPITSARKTTPIADPAIQKQLNDDFRSIQEINNEMMARAFADPNPDSEAISLDVTRINERAQRLKKNLALPRDPKSKVPDMTLRVANADDLKTALRTLHSQITSFTKNPLFQSEKLVDIDLGIKASRDLDAIILTSGKLMTICTDLKKAR